MPSDVRDDSLAPEVDTGEQGSLRYGRWLSAIPRRHDLSVGVGAIIGVSARFLLSDLAKQHLFTSFPIGTLLVNLGGCLLIGIMQTLLLELLTVRREVQLFVSVGLLGGLTTFSTFSVETVQLLAAGNSVQAVTYGAVSVIGGMGAVLIGIAIAHLVHQPLRRWGRRRA